VGDIFGPAGATELAGIGLGANYQWRVMSLRRLIERDDVEVRSLEAMIRAQLGGHAGDRAIQAIHGIGPTVAAILVAEIGDVSQFDSAAALCSWAGLTPKHRESDTKVAGRDHQAGLTPGALGV
jgi:transposase